ncbi:hypothetical protein [Kamptonema formosum]|nr:hypothetical protein [Oscillatoria sp. PCC 10802]
MGRLSLRLSRLQGALTAPLVERGIATNRQPPAADNFTGFS